MINSRTHVFSLYVGDLKPDVTEMTLFDLFSKAGTIVSIRVCKDKTTGKSLGYAYVNFMHRAEAKYALDTLNFTILKGRPIRIMWSERNPERRKSENNNIFVTNLSWNVSNKALYDVFSVYGKILSCKLVMDDQLRSNGYGYVQFANENSVNYAIQCLNGIMWNGRKITVELFKCRVNRKPNNHKQRSFIRTQVSCILDMPLDDIPVTPLIPTKTDPGNDCISLESVSFSHTNIPGGNDCISNHKEHILRQHFNPTEHMLHLPNILDSPIYDPTPTLSPSNSYDMYDDTLINDQDSGGTDSSSHLNFVNPANVLKYAFFTVVPFYWRNVHMGNLSVVTVVNFLV